MMKNYHLCIQSVWLSNLKTVLMIFVIKCVLTLSMTNRKNVWELVLSILTKAVTINRLKTFWNTF